MSENVELTTLDLRYEGHRLRNDAREARLLASIADRGIEEPLEGVDTPERRFLLNGFKRYRCARKLGIHCVPYLSLGQQEATGILTLMRVSTDKALAILEQARFYQVKLSGEPTRLIASLVYLRYSKRRYLKFYRLFNRFTMKCFLHEALMDWGYAAKQCVIDNTNLARLRGSGKQAVIVPEMVSFAERYGFRFVCHEIGHANRKEIAACYTSFVSWGAWLFMRRGSDSFRPWHFCGLCSPRGS